MLRHVRTLAPRGYLGERGGRPRRDGSNRGSVLVRSSMAGVNAVVGTLALRQPRVFPPPRRSHPPRLGLVLPGTGNLGHVNRELNLHFEQCEEILAGVVGGCDGGGGKTRGCHRGGAQTEVATPVVAARRNIDPRLEPPPARTPTALANALKWR